MINPKLEQAVAVFRELGWAEVSRDNISTLPRGTKEQQKTALAGLINGDWGEFAQLKANTYGWRSYLDVDSGSLALFAVSVGIDARRAASLLMHTDTEMVVAVVAGRGPKYAADFINFACISRRRWLEHAASVYGNVAVKLVDRLNLEIPQNIEYMKDWAVYAAAAMGKKAEVRYKEDDLPGLDLIKKRFVDHIETGVAVRVPATGPFGEVLPAGEACGWLSREQAVGLVFSALDGAVRPGDRKVWLNVLLDELKLSGSELNTRMEALIPLLSSGDNALIQRLAPILIAGADDSLRTEVLLAACSATTKKAKQIVLKTALTCPRPEDADTLAPWLTMFAEDNDKTIAALADRLMASWAIEKDVIPEEDAGILELWQEAPPVWQVPDFASGEVSAEALTELAAVMANRPAVVHDVVTEQFLAMLVAVAYQDPAAARMSLRGLRFKESLLDFVVSWVKGEPPKYGFDSAERSRNIQPPLTARDYVACRELGQLPCLLSTPGKADLSIGMADLVRRLAIYQEKQIMVQEADLFLALTRLDAATATPEDTAALKDLGVSVVLQSGEVMKVTAGEAVRNYLKYPIPEPQVNLMNSKYWDTPELSPEQSLPGFPKRLAGYQYELYSVFPNWGDATLRAVRWDYEVYHEQGLVMRQVARRAVPLTPGAAVNFLASQRSMTPDAAADAMLAVTEAWERGLLRPGVADAAMLDWSVSELSHLVALAAALDGICQSGMLAVVWPVLDALIEISLKAPRLVAGTAEIAELILAYLSETEHAVERGSADPVALQLPGVRALAARGGSSRAVNAAGKIVDRLPQMVVQVQNEELSAVILDPPFDEVWPVRAAVPIIDDGITMTVTETPGRTAKPILLFTLTIPGISDRVFQIAKQGWFYDLESEGQCRAYAAAPDATEFIENQDNTVWLHWDQDQKRMMVCDHRNWMEDKDGPLKGTRRSQLSGSLLTVIIGTLAQDGDAMYYAPHILRECIKRGELDEAMVCRATQLFVKSPAVSPAKLVRILEKELKLLPVLWPLLTGYMKYAGALVAGGEKPPVWVNRVLDIALRHAPYLCEAAKCGLMPEEDAQWQGLADLAAAKGKSAAVTKAKALMAVLKRVW